MDEDQAAQINDIIQEYKSQRELFIKMATDERKSFYPKEYSADPDEKSRQRQEIREKLAKKRDADWEKLEQIREKVYSRLFRQLSKGQKTRFTKMAGKPFPELHEYLKSSKS